MLNNATGFKKIYLATGYTDYPRSIIIREKYCKDIYLYTDQDIEDIFREADSFSDPHAVKNKYIAYEMPLLLRLLLCCGLRVLVIVSIYDRN